MILVDLRWFLLSFQTAFRRRIGTVRVEAAPTEDDIRLVARRTAFVQMLLVPLALAAARWHSLTGSPPYGPLVLFAAALWFFALLQYAVMGAVGPLITRPATAYVSYAFMNMPIALAFSVTGIHSLAFQTGLPWWAYVAVEAGALSIASALEVPSRAREFAGRAQSGRYRIRREGPVPIWYPYMPPSGKTSTRAACLGYVIVTLLVLIGRALATAYAPDPSLCIVAGGLLMIGASFAHIWLSGALAFAIGIRAIQRQYERPLALPEFHPGQPW